MRRSRIGPWIFAPAAVVTLVDMARAATTFELYPESPGRGETDGSQAGPASGPPEPRSLALLTYLVEQPDGSVTLMTQEEFRKAAGW